MRERCSIVCNWPAWTVVKANEFAHRHALSPFVVYEGKLNAAEREIEREIVPMCKSERMGITVWSPLGGGKFKSAAQSKEGEGRGRTYTGDVGSASTETFQKGLLALEKVAERKNTSTTSVAL